MINFGEKCDIFDCLWTTSYLQLHWTCQQKNFRLLMILLRWVIIVPVLTKWFFLICFIEQNIDSFRNVGYHNWNMHFSSKVKMFVWFPLFFSKADVIGFPRLLEDVNWLQLFFFLISATIILKRAAQLY